LWVFEILSQRVELSFPELPVFFNPFRSAFYRLADQPAAVDASVFTPLNQLGAFEHTQVFRDGGKRHVIRGGEIADGRFASCEPRQDAAARGIGKRRKGVIECQLIVNHMVYYRSVEGFCQVKSLELKGGEQVAQLVFLGLKVGARMFARSRAAGNPLYDANARSLQLRHFVRIV
jgi:hypothetical protein